MFCNRTPYGVRDRNFRTLEDLHEETSLDASADAFTPPDDLALTQPDQGHIARIRDGLHIAENVREAAVSLEVEKDSTQRAA